MAMGFKSPLAAKGASIIHDRAWNNTADPVSPSASSQTPTRPLKYPGGFGQIGND